MTVNMQKAARGKRPKYFDDEAIDRCLSMVMALAQEVWVMRERCRARVVWTSAASYATLSKLRMSEMATFWNWVSFWVVRRAWFDLKELDALARSQ